MCEKYYGNVRKLRLFDTEITEPVSGFFTGTDALLLAAFVKGQPLANAVEFGAGTGAVSLICASKNKFAHIYSVEVQKPLFLLLKENIDRNGFAKKITPFCADVRNINPAVFGKVSAVFANPPYMTTGSGKSSDSDLKQIARHEVFGGVEDFCAAAARILKTGGRLYLVYRTDRLETLMSALKKSGFAAKRMTFVCSDRTSSPSCVLTEAVLGGKESLFITPVLFLKSDGAETADAKMIYENAVFPDKFIKN